MQNPQNKFVIPHKRFAPVNSVDFLKQQSTQQNNLNNNVGGSSKNITVPEFYSPIPGTPNDATHSSKQGNITNSLAISNSAYDKHAFEGGRKSRKHKQKRKSKKHKQKSKKHKRKSKKHKGKRKSKKLKQKRKSKKH